MIIKRIIGCALFLLILTMFATCAAHEEGRGGSQPPAPTPAPTPIPATQPPPIPTPTPAPEAAAPKEPLADFVTKEIFAASIQALADSHHNADFAPIITTRRDPSRFGFRIFNAGYALQFGRAEYGWGWGITGPEGSLVVPHIYRSLHHHFGHFLTAENFEGLWGLIDLHGSIIIPFIFPEPPMALYTGAHFSQDLYRIADGPGGRFAIVNTAGEMLAPFIYEDIEPSYMGYFAAKLGGAWGIIDNDGREAVPFQYQALAHLRDNLFHARADGLWGVVDIAGDVTVPLIYTERITDVQDGMAIVSERSAQTGALQAGVIELGTGNMLIPMTYRGISFLANNLLAVSIQRDWGIVDLHNNEMIPANYCITEMRMLAHLMGGQIRAAYGNIRRIHWFDELRQDLGGPRGTPQMELLCLATGRTARARPIWNGNHADIVGTTAVYQALLADFWQVLVIVGNADYAMPAAIRRFAPSTHFCLHFYGSTQNNNNSSWGMGHILHGERAGELIARYISNSA